MRCEALLFDMDGVLVDSGAVYERTWRRWAERHGLDPDPLLAAGLGRRTREALRSVVPHLATDAEVEWLDTAELEDLEGIVEVPGAARLVASLPEERWAVVTSAGRDLARRRLDRAGVPAPPVLVTAEDITRGKPAPDGYLLAAQRLHRTAAACIVFEDAPAGIEAARAAGMRSIALTTTYAADRLPPADAWITDFRKVAARLDGTGIVVQLPAQTPS